MPRPGSTKSTSCPEGQSDGHMTIFIPHNVAGKYCNQKTDHEKAAAQMTNNKKFIADACCFTVIN